MSRLKQKLQAALDLLGPNGENWCKYDYSDGSGRFCGLGALKQQGIPWTFYTELSKYIPSKSGECYIYWMWQDRESTTFNDVKAVFERAIAACED